MMTRLLKTFLFLISAAVFFACGNANTQNEAVEIPETAEEQHEHHDHDHVSTEAIELNNGERWEVNEEMKPHILRGEEVLSNYLNREGNDYKALAEQIAAANKELISSCTMKGKSHDELHKWLEPHLELTKKLADEDDESHAGEIIAELEKSFREYHNYFQ